MLILHDPKLRNPLNTTEAKVKSTHERARIPSTKKYRVRTVLIRSLGKNLKRRNSDSRTALPMNGNRIACSFDTVSCTKQHVCDSK
jgi:hypothetical protein